MIRKKILVFIICMIAVFIIAVPICSKMYFERTRFTKPISTNIYGFDFINHWKQVTDLLDLDDNAIKTAIIENLSFNYYRSGEIQDITYRIIWKVDEQLYQAQVSFNDSEKYVDVNAFKISESPQYDYMVRADSLFSKLNEVKIKELTSKDDYPYYGLSFGASENQTILNGEVFAIEENNIVALKRNMPVKGFWIRTYCMEQYQAEDYRSTLDRNYIVNLR